MEGKIGREVGNEEIRMSETGLVTVGIVLC